MTKEDAIRCRVAFAGRCVDDYTRWVRDAEKRLEEQKARLAEWTAKLQDAENAAREAGIDPHVW